MALVSENMLEKSGRSGQSGDVVVSVYVHARQANFWRFLLLNLCPIVTHTCTGMSLPCIYSVCVDG